MKAIFNRDVLLAALAPAAAVAPAKNTISTIEGILFECPGETEGTCRITSYDMEKGLRTSIAADIMEEGKIELNCSSMGSKICQYLTKE